MIVNNKSNNRIREVRHTSPTHNDFQAIKTMSDFVIKYVLAIRIPRVVQPVFMNSTSYSMDIITIL